MVQGVMHNPYAQALDFLVDAGVTTPLQNDPNNRFLMPEISFPNEGIETNNQKSTLSATQDTSAPSIQTQPQSNLSHAEFIKQAEELASNANTLNDLKSAIENFDGLSIKKTATQIVFADGTESAKIMVIGDTPLSEDDRNGLPFMGNEGTLCDKIFASISLKRKNDLYLTNIINWRPPGNRTATKEEIDISAPFLMRHIELIKPDYIVTLGTLPAQILLKSKDSISRLRGKIHQDNGDITAKIICTYHPSVLLNTPVQKKKVWQDMLMLQGALNG